MEMKATYTFDATPDRVFDVMTDPSIVAACLPGCEGLEPIGEGDEQRYRAVLRIGVAAITGRYEGTVAIVDVDRPRAYTIRVEGRGTPGAVTGQGRITLEPSGEQTIVQVAGHAQVVGTIARVGQRLLGGVSKMMTDKFFACLCTKVSGDS